MTTITIAYEVSAEKFQTIAALVEEQQTHNVNFNGEEISIERGDFTQIDEDGAEYVQLLNKIQDIILGYN